LYFWENYTVCAQIAFVIFFLSNSFQAKKFCLCKKMLLFVLLAASVLIVVYICHFFVASGKQSAKTAVKSKFGVYMKPGLQAISTKEFETCMQFLESGVWRVKDLPTEECSGDPLIAMNPTYGEFMMAFDFHLTPTGPKLIEINTNADNVSTALQILDESGRRAESDHIRSKIVHAIFKEYKLACPLGTLKCVCIVDFELCNHRMIEEYEQIANLLRKAGIDCFVAEPHEIARENDRLYYDGKSIDLIYNRLSTDKRLLHPDCKLIRDVAIKEGVVLTPHPAVYVRTADKRQLVKMQHQCVPKSFVLSERTRTEWWKTRLNYVFKPFTGYASQGVVIGAEMTQRDLRAMRDDHVVQKFVETPLSNDGSRFDFRLYTHGKNVFIAITRHFVGEKMNMQHPFSGIRLTEVQPHVDRIYPERIHLQDKSLDFISTEDINRKNKRSEEERLKTKKSIQH